MSYHVLRLGPWTTCRCGKTHFSRPALSKSAFSSTSPLQAVRRYIQMSVIVIVTVIFIILYNWTSTSIGVNLKYLNTGFHSHGDTPKFGCFDGKSPDNKWIMNKGTPWYSYDLGHIHMPCWCSTQDQAINDPSLLDQDLVTQYFGNLWNSRGAMAPWRHAPGIFALRYLHILNTEIHQDIRRIHHDTSIHLM